MPALEVLAAKERLEHGLARSSQADCVRPVGSGEPFLPGPPAADVHGPHFILAQGEVEAKPLADSQRLALGNHGTAIALNPKNRDQTVQLGRVFESHRAKSRRQLLDLDVAIAHLMTC